MRRAGVRQRAGDEAAINVLLSEFVSQSDLEGWDHIVACFATTRNRSGLGFLYITFRYPASIASASAAGGARRFESGRLPRAR